MLEIIGSITALLINIFGIYLMMGIILKSEEKILSVKGVASQLIIAGCIIMQYKIEYQIFNTVAVYITIVLLCILMYKVMISKACISAGVMMIVMFVADVITATTLLMITDIAVMRGTVIYQLIGNLMVILISLFIVTRKYIKKKIHEIIDLTVNKKNTELIMFIILIIIILSCLTYNVATNSKNSQLYIVDIFLMVMFFILVFIFFTEKYEKEKLNVKHDFLLEYVKEFEDTIDNEKMNMHESKNQLATLREMVKNNKKAVDYIDNIIGERIKNEYNSIDELKNVPNGGLKGLLFYKVSIAKNKNIDFLLNISNKVKNKLKKLSIEDNKDLCRIIGIYLDNAIEASVECKEKAIISLEIYMIKGEINIVISNTYNGKVIKIEQFRNKGYTTKGSGHGNGLYYVSKIISKNNKFKQESNILNNYYICKLTIQN